VKKFIIGIEMLLGDVCKHKLLISKTFKAILYFLNFWLSRIRIRIGNPPSHSGPCPPVLHPVRCASPSEEQRSRYNSRDGLASTHSLMASTHSLASSHHGPSSSSLMTSSHRAEAAASSNIMFSSLQSGLPFSDFPPFAEETLHGEASTAPLADNNLTRGDDNPADNDLNNSVVGEEDSEEEKEEIDDEAKVRFLLSELWIRIRIQHFK
jgi:hypothetical protein